MMMLLWCNKDVSIVGSFWLGIGRRYWCHLLIKQELIFIFTEQYQTLNGEEINMDYLVLSMSWPTLWKSCSNWQQSNIIFHMLHVFNFYFLMHNHLKMIKETLYANSYKEMDFGDSGVACQWHGRQREVVRHSQSNHSLTLTPLPLGSNWTNFKIPLFPARLKLYPLSLPVSNYYFLPLGLNYTPFLYQCQAMYPLSLPV